MKSNKIKKEPELSESQKLAATLSAEEREACEQIMNNLLAPDAMRFYGSIVQFEKNTQSAL